MALKLPKMHGHVYGKKIAAGIGERKFNICLFTVTNAHCIVCTRGIYFHRLGVTVLSGENAACKCIICSYSGQERERERENQIMIGYIHRPAKIV